MKRIEGKTINKLWMLGPELLFLFLFLPPAKNEMIVRATWLVMAALFLLPFLNHCFGLYKRYWIACGFAGAFASFFFSPTGKTAM